MQIASYARRFGLAIYWALFAAYTLYAAQFPGLTLHPERWTYPWKGVFFIWGLLAVLVGALYLILRPATYRWSWGRLVCALIYAAVLLYLGIMTVVTDMPGFMYVPALFAVATMALVLVMGIVQVALALWAR